MMAFFAEIFRAFMSANTQMFADNKKHRIPNACDVRDKGLFNNVCLILSAKSCGFCGEAFSEGNTVYKIKRLTMPPNNCGTNP